jgi:hypothetical protein
MAQTKEVRGIHPNRGKVVTDLTGKQVLRSKRQGSGLRKHLGDHITDTTYTGKRDPDELQIREAALNRK